MGEEERKAFSLQSRDTKLIGNVHETLDVIPSNGAFQAAGVKMNGTVKKTNGDGEFTADIRI